MVLHLISMAVAILLVSMQLVLLYLIAHELKCAKKDIVKNVINTIHTYLK